MKKQFSISTNLSAQRRNMQALHSLMSVIELNEPRAVQIVPVVVFMAFTVEAYINSLGFQYVSEWSEKERKPWKEKIKLLHKAKNKSTDWNSPPLDFANKLFEIRDRLAHGKPESVNGPFFDSVKEAQDHIVSSDIDPDWFNKLGSVWYSKANEQFFELMEYLASMYDLSPTDYLQASTSQIIKHY